jgi:hypothetical protein
MKTGLIVSTANLVNGTLSENRKTPRNPSQSPER